MNYSNTISGIFDPIWNYNNSLYKVTVSAYGDVYTGSNSITTNFLRNIYNNGFIDSSMKKTVSENLEALNRVGVISFGGIGFTASGENIFHGKAALTGGIEYNLQQTADFTPDAFHLVFYGNYDLQDSTAILDQTSFSGIKYNKYRIGVVKPYERPDGTLTLGLMLNLIQGLSTNNINIPTGSFYTAPYGTLLSLDYQFNITNTEKDSSILDWNGAGAAADFYLDYYFPKIKTRFSVSALDLGFVNWYKGSKKITADTSLIFEGIAIDDLLNSTASVFTSDTIFEMLGVKETELAFTKMLPAKLNISLVKEFPSNWYALIGAQHIFNNTYAPLFYLKSGKLFPESGTALDLLAEYGGYGGLSFGLGISQRITDHASLQLNASNFLGLIAPDKLTGAAFFIKLNTAF